MSTAGPSFPPLKLVVEPGASPFQSSLERQYDAALRESHESFATALTSPRDDPPVPADSPNGSSSSISPSHGLRRSLSVDSFVQYGREGPSGFNAGPRPNRVYTSTGMAPPPGLVFDISSRTKRENDKFHRPTRLRGASVVSSGGDYDQSFNEDSDVERSDPLNRLADGGRLVSSKAQDKAKQFVRAGELPLPSRTPTLSSTSSMSSASGTSASSVDHVPRMQSSQSIQTMTRRGTGTFVGITPGRARSGSLGVYVSHSGKSTLVNTQPPVYDTPLENTVTFIVVGAPNCGKSTVIHKGLKGYSLADPATFLMPSRSLDIQISTRYTRRIGRITHGENAPDRALHVLEIAALMPRGNLHVKKGSFWPDGAPRVDGVVICYDASDPVSFTPVEGLLQGYHALKLPMMGLACKSDLDRKIDPQKASQVLQKYDVGLVEVSNDREGKEKMRRSFAWLIRSIFRGRRSTNNDFDHYRNPASPDVLSPPPWETPRTVTPTASSVVPINAAAPTSSALAFQPPAVPLLSTPRPPSHSPTRARSAGDLLSERERSKNRDLQQETRTAASNGITHLPNSSTGSLHKATLSTGTAVGEREDPIEKDKGARPVPWASLEELLDKLVFLTVSGEDPAFITHFLLTYRRFSSPRSVLLAMQKRMRQLDNPSGDPMFACFAQMRICHLLELWIRDHPHDFAVRGTAGALSALIKSIIGKTHLLHYGSDFLPFLEVLPNLIDKDAAWALKPDDITDESDDSYSLCEDDDSGTPTNEINSAPPDDRSPVYRKAEPPLPSQSSSRERKPSLPLTAKALMMTHSQAYHGGAECQDLPTKQACRDLVKIAQEVNTCDSDEIAQEITKLEAKLFLDIEPRHWLQFCMVSGKKDPATDPIARFSEVSNHLANWVVSLILCHDRSKARAKQIEKFVDIAQKLRTLNNYSALRAFVAGINNSTFPGDETMEIFKSKSPDHAKNLQSWDLLLQRIRSHSAYRMALRNSKGACIPALEVHMSDLIGAQEGNPDENPDDPTKIHWGKFNIMGKFISSITQCQLHIRSTTDYAFPDRPHINHLIMKPNLMCEEVQKARIAPPPDDSEVDDGFRQPATRAMSRDSHHQMKEPVLRKFKLW